MVQLTQLLPFFYHTNIQTPPDGNDHHHHHPSSSTSTTALTTGTGIYVLPIHPLFPIPMLLER